VSARPARAADQAAIAALFQRSGSPCHCRWWHFAGDKNAWLDRCANAPAESARELAQALETGSPEARGIVALDDSGQVVGWMKLTEKGAVTKIYEQRLYRGLPCFDGPDAGVWTIGCFLVDDAHRAAGVGRVMIRAGLAMARQAGARAVEAFPRRAEGLAAEEKWTGSFSALCEEGFIVVHDFAPYPVVRCELSADG
jgi:predicted N-acetyltransferase YhbS